MPWTTTYGARGVEVAFTGRSDAADVFAAHDQIFGRPFEEGLQYMIVDLAGVEYLDLPNADLLRIAEHHRQYALRNPPSF